MGALLTRRWPVGFAMRSMTSRENRGWADAGRDEGDGGGGGTLSKRIDATLTSLHDDGFCFFQAAWRVSRVIGSSGALRSLVNSGSKRIATRAIGEAGQVKPFSW